MKEIYLQIKYIIGRPSWWIGTLISFIAMMQGFISEGIYQSKNLIYMMTVAMNYGVFIPLAPLAAVISVGGHLESAITNDVEKDSLFFIQGLAPLLPGAWL